MKLKQFWVLGIIFAAVLFNYGQTLDFEYVWDDTLIFIDRADLLNDPLSWSLLSQPVLEGTTYLRPLVFLSWFLEFRLFGQHPAISHAVNLLLFSVNISILYFLTLKIASQMGRSRPTFLASSAALFYAMHPALVESTAWVSGRFDLMATLFMLLGSYSVLRWGVRSAAAITVYVICLAGAVFSKELGLVLPAIVLCLLWWQFHYERHGKGGVEFLTYYLSVILASASFYIGYFVLRALSMESQYHMPLSADWLIHSFSNLLPFEALKYYLIKAVVPFDSITLFSPITSLRPFALQSLLADFVLLLALVVLIRQAIVNPTASVMLLCSSLLGILLVLHFVPISILENIGHERFMPLPLAFFVMAVILTDYNAAAIRFKLRSKFASVLLRGVAMIWLAGAIFTTATLVPIWRNEFSMWSWAYSVHPEVEVVANNYVAAAISQGRYELAEEYLTDKRDSDEGLSVAHQISYSLLLLRAGDEESIKFMEGVIYALPKFHLQEEGEYAARRFLIPSQNMAVLYLNYAVAQMIFNGDLDAANHYLDVALFYTRPSQQLPFSYFEVALLYAQGEQEKSLALYEGLQRKKHFSQQHISRSVWKTLSSYCEKNPSKSHVCAQAEKDGRFNR